MPIESIFPTPIYYSSVDNLDEITKQIDAVLENINFSYKGDWGKTHHLSDVNFRENFIIDNKIDLLHEEIKHHILVYFAEMRCPKQRLYNIVSSWVSLFKPGDYGHIHSHGYYDISGVYYHKTNGKDGDIFFNPPNPHLHTSYCYEHLSWPWIHTPEKGKIILFPSWLQHGIKTNETDDDRISISFNIKFTQTE